jgi:serine/threonine protein kinase/tetratricopeptide (TPR) repeat protein
MTPERYQQMKAIFQAVEEAADGERTALLDGLSAGDPSLIDAVRQLREAAQQSNSLLAPDAPYSASKLLERFDSAPIEGRKIGNYEVAREIGRGGMGRVYLALRSDDFQKSVAIKFLDSSSGSRSVLERFYRERQILAGLDHPNIARLLDGGTADGKPYLVMDYIEGLPIDEYCDKQRISIQQRLRLFLPVCEAVQYAHRNLIVHRDLKPSNILITSEGIPKLLDFGIAKLLSAGATSTTALTRAEGHPMTPEYASPEQLLGSPVTTATDVYSLAVVLYELLTGHKPFGSKISTIDEFYKLVQERREPSRPSVVAASVERVTSEGQEIVITPAEVCQFRNTQPDKLRRALMGDLDNILLRALHSEVERRYPSVDQFAEDIRRHLEGLPVRARKDTLSYRAAKFVRRNPALVAIASAFVLTLFAGICATEWQARVARAERAQAERRFEQVRNLAHSVIFEVHAAIQSLPGSTSAQKLLVERAGAYLDSLVRESAHDISLQLELASAYAKLGDIQWSRYYAHLGDRDGALRSQQKAFEIRRALVTEHPTNQEAKLGLGHSYLSLGDLMTARGQVREALEYYRHSLSIRAEGVHENPNDETAEKNLAIAYQRVGDTLGNPDFGNLGDLAGAQSNFEKMQAINLRLAAKQPKNLQYLHDLGIGFEKLARVHSAMGDWSGTLDLFRKEQEAFESTAAAQPGNVRFERDLAVGYGDMAVGLSKLGKPAESLQFCRKMLQVRERLAGADPDDSGAHNDLCSAYRVSSGIALQDSKRKQARQWAEKLLESEKQWAERPGATPEDLNSLAWDLLTMPVAEVRRPSLALVYAKRAVEMDGAHDPTILDTLAQALSETDDRQQAIALELNSISLAGSNPILRRQLEAHLAKIQQNVPSRSEHTRPR